MNKFFERLSLMLSVCAVAFFGACNLQELAENGQIDFHGEDFQKICNAENPNNKLEDPFAQEVLLFSVEEVETANELMAILKSCEAVSPEGQQEFIRKSEYSGNHWFRVNLESGIKAQNYAAALVYHSGVATMEKENDTYEVAPSQDSLAIQPLGN